MSRKFVQSQAAAEHLKTQNELLDAKIKGIEEANATELSRLEQLLEQARPDDRQAIARHKPHSLQLQCLIYSPRLALS